jgi:hypothetical protein
LLRPFIRFLENKIMRVTEHPSEGDKVLLSLYELYPFYKKTLPDSIYEVEAIISEIDSWGESDRIHCSIEGHGNVACLNQMDMVWDYGNKRWVCSY